MPDSPSLQRRQLGIELKRLREEAGKSRDDAAAKLNRDLSTISRIENGLSGMRAAELEKLLDLYGVLGEPRENVLAVGVAARQRRIAQTYTDAVPNWFRRYAALEAEATEVRGFEVELVPGLLQSEDYLRTLMGSVLPTVGSAEVERRIRVRLSRQALLRRTDPPAPLFRFVLNEAVLRREIGGPKVMAAQLNHLLDIARLPNVTVQVLPFRSGAHPAVGFSFYVLRFGDDPSADVVYLDSLSSAMYPERRADIDCHNVVLGQLQVRSADPEKSREMITSVVEEYM
jgi:transcriptional regulator with XRE-family HTH domain